MHLNVHVPCHLFDDSQCTLIILLHTRCVQLTKLIVGRVVVGVDFSGSIKPLARVHRLSEVLQISFGVYFSIPHDVSKEVRSRDIVLCVESCSMW